MLFLSFQVFFVLINNEDEALHDAAITVASITELALYGITTAAVVVGMIQGWQKTYIGELVGLVQFSENSQKVKLSRPHSGLAVLSYN